jgi:hypothetical protein
VRRRRFLGATLSAAAGVFASPSSALAGPLEVLRARFPDLRRRFVFEYYPWYAADPFRHWADAGRTPPFDVASAYLPRLGAYDSRSAAVLEQHARWIAESGAGSINLSWWGPDSFEDRVTPLVMDVMRDHDVKVTFHLEPYAPDHGRRFAQNVLDLIERFGERRRFDAMLLLRDPDGGVGPVFKGFRTILPATVANCRGVEEPVPDFTLDREWRTQTDVLRNTLRGDFDRVTLLSDSLHVERVEAGGFDGIAIYDPFVGPARYPAAAQDASARGLLFSLNVNAGFLLFPPRAPVFDDCGGAVAPLPFVPPAPDLDLSTPVGREAAAVASSLRIRESFKTTVALQADPALANARRGFFLAYINSWNEWHEGTAFEPMKDSRALSAAEMASGYANPLRGDYRLRTLAGLLRPAAGR